MTSREAYLILQMLPGIGAVRVRMLLDHLETPEAILNANSTTLAKSAGIGAKLAATISTWPKYVDLEKEKAVADRSGIDWITWADDDYPELLKNIYDPPLCLFVRGNKAALNRTPALAIVGSRRTTRYGIEMTQRLSQAAVMTGWTVVSGLAYGIDTVAHHQVVDSDGVTIAVLAGGLGQIYPQDNVALARSICRNGALISEQPIMAAPDKRSFPLRNRIISGLSLGTLVVEAGNNSGALITAQSALDQGRQVFAVPGRVDSPQSRGCHSLLKQGAKLVETIADINDEFSDLFRVSRLASADGTRADNAATDDHRSGGVKLTPAERQVIDLLRGTELSIDEIKNQLNISMPTALSILLGLELKKLVLSLPGKRYGLKP